MTIPVYDSVAYLASDKFVVFNAAGDSFVSEFAPGARLRADCGTDGVLLGTVAASSFEAATGRTVVTTAMDGGVALTANLAAVLHGNDLPESLCAHAALHAIGGRDALPGATTGVSGLVSLASSAETQAGTLTGKAVTPAGLAASVKGLISANMTIYVAATGSDATGTGASGAPYATIAKALSSISGKLIASGAIVTIQVADGAYSISSAIVIDHPDADKIQILGNASAETTVAISAIDTTAKTITVAGNYVTNADATKNIQAGDIIGLTGSSTSGLNGAYVVSAVSYNGTNTVIASTAETIASSTVGGGSIVIKPCNSVTLTVASGVNAFTVSSVKLKYVNGFKIISSGGTAYAFYIYPRGGVSSSGKLIIKSFTYAALAHTHSEFIASSLITKGCTYTFSSDFSSVVYIYGSSILDSSTSRIATAQNGSIVSILAASNIIRNAPGTPYSPAADTTGNGGAVVRTV